jgi:hypothetical protein
VANAHSDGQFTPKSAFLPYLYWHAQAFEMKGQHLNRFILAPAIMDNGVFWVAASSIGPAV